MWTKVSPQIKDLCARLLERDPEKRFTYQQAMDHPWLNVDTYPSAALNDTMVQKFQSHGSFHRLKRKVLTEALKYLELEETGELAMIFSKLDVDHDGFITKKEMVRGLQQYGYIFTPTTLLTTTISARAIIAKIKRQSQVHANNKKTEGRQQL